MLHPHPGLRIGQSWTVRPFAGVSVIDSNSRQGILPMVGRTSPCVKSASALVRRGAGVAGLWRKFGVFPCRISEAFPFSPLPSSFSCSFSTVAASGASAGRKGYLVDLTGQVAFVAGVADSTGYGWAIARILSEAGATVLVGAYPPALPVLKRSMRGEGEGVVSGVYPLDATFSTPEEVTEEIKSNRRYSDLPCFDIRSTASSVGIDHSKVDILVHAVANSPEVQKPLLDTTRSGYLAAQSASSYSFLSLLQEFGHLMPHGSSALTLSYAAANCAIPGYGGGMSSAKASLESDVRTLAWEAGRRWGIRVNAISAGPLKSRAASAIGQGDASFIDQAIRYSRSNSPLARSVSATDVAGAALALSSPLSAAITGEVLRVDCGLHAMGMAQDSRSFPQ